MATLAERYWNNVDRSSTTGCWPWLAGRDGQGYGAIRVDGRTEKAHRVGYALVYGPIPDGLFVCHHCDNPPCNRPEHWFLGSPADNMADRDAKGRASRSPRNQGEAHGMARLTEADVREIRRRRAAGELIRTIAADFGMTQPATGQIINRRRWKHVI